MVRACSSTKGSIMLYPTTVRENGQDNETLQVLMGA